MYPVLGATEKEEAKLNELSDKIAAFLMARFNIRDRGFWEIEVQDGKRFAKLFLKRNEKVERILILVVSDLFTHPLKNIIEHSISRVEISDQLN